MGAFEGYDSSLQILLIQCLDNACFDGHAQWWIQLGNYYSLTQENRLFIFSVERVLIRLIGLLHLLLKVLFPV